jgi:hypothetical protein
MPRNPRIARKIRAAAAAICSGTEVEPEFLMRRRQSIPTGDVRPVTIRYHRWEQKDVAALTMSSPVNCVAPPLPYNHIDMQEYLAKVEAYLKEQGIEWQLQRWVSPAGYRTPNRRLLRKDWTVYLLASADEATATAVREMFQDELR